MPKSKKSPVDGLSLGEAKILLEVARKVADGKTLDEQLETLVALVTAAMGGYVGAAFARKLPAVWLKRVVIAVGATLTVVYFIKTA